MSISRFLPNAEWARRDNAVSGAQAGQCCWDVKMCDRRSDEELEEKTWKEEDDWTDRVSTTLRAAWIGLFTAVAGGGQQVWLWRAAVFWTSTELYVN